MNDKQKIFAIVSVVSFVLWIGLSVADERRVSFDDMFEETGAIIALAIGVGSLVGFFLFKNKYEANMKRLWLNPHPKG